MRLFIEDNERKLIAEFKKHGRELVCVDSDQELVWMRGRRARLIRAYLNARGIKYEFESTTAAA